jgi:hypothetical protein
MALDPADKIQVYKDTVEIVKAFATSHNSGNFDGWIPSIYDELIKIREKAHASKAQG